MKFSIIVPHYDGSISDERFLEGMESLSKSTFKDFEVLIYHDGPVSRPLPNIDHLGLNYKFKETRKRYNNWGHSQRDLGIKDASGDFIVHFNPDNILYENALQAIYENETLSVRGATVPFDILICPIHMEGMVRTGEHVMRTYDPKHLATLTGAPTMLYNIDCMQLVMKRSLWLKYGGWYDKSETSDGVMYSRFVEENKSKTRYISEFIGLHR